MNHVITDLTDSGQDMLYTSSGNVMFVKFTSDHSEPRRGFQACVCDSSKFRIISMYLPCTRCYYESSLIVYGSP